MAGGAGPERASGGLRTSRLDGLSDAVFAVALTILVLELGVPTGSEGHLLRAILEEWPSYLAYAVSFSTIGAAWLAHSAITQLLHHADVGFVRLNLILLLVVSFLPYPTRLLTEYVGNEDAARRSDVAGTVGREAQPARVRSSSGVCPVQELNAR